MHPIPYGRQHITDDDIRAVTAVLRADYLTQGPKVAEFERVFAQAVGAPYAVAVSNATAALHLAALVLGVKPGKKVISAPLSFVASTNCVLYCGGGVDFSDIDPETYLLDLKKLRTKLESSPRGTYSGVVAVDFAGLPVDTEALRKLADEHGLWILEDACHAPGATFKDSKGRVVRSGDGTYSDLTVFSFHPVKHIATGEGGMITTRDKALHHKLMRLRTHGITKNTEEFRDPSHGPWYMEMQELGFNYRMPDILAALGVSQMTRFESQIKRRREIAARYDRAFRGTPVTTAPQVPGRENAFHLYVVQIPDRSKVHAHLAKNGVLAQVHYLPIHLMPYYRSLGWKKGAFPAAEAYYERCLSLPMFPTLSDEDQDHVIAKVLEAVRSV